MDIDITLGIGIRTSIKKLYENLNEDSCTFIKNLLFKTRIWGKELIFENNDEFLKQFLYTYQMTNAALLEENNNDDGWIVIDGEKFPIFDGNTSECKIALALFALKDHEIYDTHFCFQFDLHNNLIGHDEYVPIEILNSMFDDRTCRYCSINEFESRFKQSIEIVEKFVVENDLSTVVEIVVMNTLRTRSLQTIYH
tara:strand:- start:1770 stop:2357 length:588 start_codon:yes stop_codon:yes gene_type:complete